MFDLHPIFKLREEPTESIIQLLESVTLGTNGTQYRHLDARQRISEADASLFLSIERNERVFGNVTFCQRDDNWYIRYYAFDEAFQSEGKQKSRSGDGMIKSELKRFFKEVDQKHGKTLYAYIDPHNEKSLWMSEFFGLNKISMLSTQTFSRTKNKKETRVHQYSDWTKFDSLVRSTHAHKSFYFEAQCSKAPFYAIFEKQECVAFAKVNTAHWKFDRMPGRWGNTKLKLIPFVPKINNIIHPEDHYFAVPEAIYIKNNDPYLLEELFEGILSWENANSMFWWIDSKDQLYQNVTNKVSWGPLHKIVGVNEVSVVARGIGATENTEVFISGFDFI